MQVNSDTIQNRYRPKKFENVIGQHIATNILQGIIKHKTYTFTRSYILHAQQGTGKTTLARIFANAIFCQHSDQQQKPCLHCEHCIEFKNNTHPDYVELDGARYNKVEDIAQLVELAKIYPLKHNGYRVIVIDEAHRLSNASFDSLLKLLEDAITKTLFIFVTTEISKIRPAIISRSIVLQLKNLSNSEIAQTLSQICNKENIQCSEIALQTLAHQAKGDLRSAIKQMDTYLRANNSLIGIIPKSNEGVMLESLTKAFMQQIDQAVQLLDDLIIPHNAYGDILASVLYILYQYPNNISIIPKQVLETKYKVISHKLKGIMIEFLKYKPQTKEQLIMFYYIMQDLNKQDEILPAQQQGNQRQLFRDKQ